MSIKVEKRLQVPVWDEAQKKRVIDFWSRRRIIFSETADDTLIGTRGNWCGNLTSFDMSKLISKLTITFLKQNELYCVLHINTTFQVITEYNRAWWDLEMDTFESFLLRNDEQEQKWEKFNVAYKKAAWAWSFSRGIKGNKMPPEEKL